MTIQQALQKVIDGNDLDREEMRSVFDAIMGGQATPAQIAAFIVALRMKGESVGEITGAAEVMREKATHVLPRSAGQVVDTCGTGGDRSHSFNISTAAAFVAAGAGAPVAKHGNRCVSSSCGSADVLEGLGVRIAVGPDTMKACLDEIGICFLFAPSLHGAMKHAIGPRREIGVRTIFNILGPLTNPSLARRHLLGVFSPALTATMASVLGNMGSERAFVVHGHGGMDEISLSGETQVSELSGGSVTTYSISPEQFGFGRSPMESIAGGTVERNAEIIRDVLSGRPGPHRDVTVLNAAFACAASGICAGPQDGVARAEESIDSGAAREKLEKLAAMTNAQA